MEKGKETGSKKGWTPKKVLLLSAGLGAGALAIWQGVRLYRKHKPKVPGLRRDELIDSMRMAGQRGPFDPSSLLK